MIDLLLLNNITPSIVARGSVARKKGTYREEGISKGRVTSRGRDFFRERIEKNVNAKG